MSNWSTPHVNPSVIWHALTEQIVAHLERGEQWRETPQGTIEIRARDGTIRTVEY